MRRLTAAGDWEAPIKQQGMSCALLLLSTMLIGLTLAPSTELSSALLAPASSSSSSSSSSPPADQDSHVHTLAGMAASLSMVWEEGQCSCVEGMQSSVLAH